MRNVERESNEGKVYLTKLQKRIRKGETRAESPVRGEKGKGGLDKRKKIPVF